METVSRTLLTFLLNALWQVPLAWAVAALGAADHSPQRVLSAIEVVQHGEGAWQGAVFEHQQAGHERRPPGRPVSMAPAVGAAYRFQPAQ